MRRATNGGPGSGTTRRAILLLIRLVLLVLRRRQEPFHRQFPRREWICPLIRQRHIEFHRLVIGA
jgi:hypothetical protein